MIARISTHFACTETDLWKKIIEPRSLQFVASPVLSFIPDKDSALDGQWIVGKKYHLRLYFLKFIPLGSHTIELVKIDKAANTISSKEKGKLARVWNHDITFHEVSPGKVLYTDKIEIRAGLLSPMIWLFAHFFYRHRQRRWKLLLEGQRCRQKASFGDK